MTATNKSHPLRKPCASCCGTSGRIQTRNGQDCVFCLCGRFQYNAPKTETGREVRCVSATRGGIKPRQRSRILNRATGRCEICGAKGDLHVGHLLSVDQGTAQGVEPAELNCDENLACMCSECNLGLGNETIPLRLATAIIHARATA